MRPGMVAQEVRESAVSAGNALNMSQRRIVQRRSGKTRTLRPMDVEAQRALSLSSPLSAHQGGKVGNTIVLGSAASSHFLSTTLPGNHHWGQRGR